MQKSSPEEKRHHLRYLARTDLYFLLRYGLNREDISHPWLFDRCREVQASPNDHIDLWGREHYKSTVITYAKTIQDILASHGDDPIVDKEITVGIFSHTRPIAKSFLRQIKRDLEGNELLYEWFPDILWENPQRDAPKWSEDDGIIVQRKTNPKEATLEAWGVVDGQPTGKHFDLLIYDDVVTKDSVTTPEMIEKTMTSLEMSYSLGAMGGHRRFIGTRYHFNDPYRTIMARGTAEPRVYPATIDGTVDGEPVLITREQLAQKRRDMGPYTFATQMLQDPKADETQGFKYEWLEFHTGLSSYKDMNLYMLFDPASGKKKGNDYTAGWCVGLGTDENIYVIDMIRDRLNLEQRGNLVMDWHRKYEPREVRYEKYAMSADVEYIQSIQKRDNYRFEIKEVGGQLSKNDRIKRLIPYFSSGRIILPRALYKTDYEGVMRNLIDVFIEEEYKSFPVSHHDDMLDALARLLEPDFPLIWPKKQKPRRPSSVGHKTWEDF